MEEDRESRDHAHPTAGKVGGAYGKTVSKVVSEIGSEVKIPRDFNIVRMLRYCEEKEERRGETKENFMVSEGLYEYIIVD